MFKKVIINGKMYNLITKEEYMKNKNYYDTEGSTAIETPDGFALPVTQGRNNVGVYSSPNEKLVRYTMPSEEEQDMYRITDENKIDFTTVNNINDYYNKYIEYNDSEREILTTTTNKFKPKVKEDDSPLLKLVKESICDKNIDIDKYADRFDNFNNNKRLLSPAYNDITMNKATLLLDNLDVDVYAITINKDNDVPNPMSKPFIRKITGEGEEFDIDSLIDVLKGGNDNE